MAATDSTQRDWNGIQTLTLDQFKDVQNITGNIQVLRNSATDKLFFTFTSKIGNGRTEAKTGAVSAKGIPTNVMFTEFPDETNPDNTVWVMHNAGEGGATVEASF